MPSSFIVINAPKNTTSTSAGLLNAIQSAQPGEVITVETAGDPLTLNLTAITKSGYGVCVSLPLDQQIRVICGSGTSNIHFFGGQFAADKVTGDRGASNRGLDVLSGCSKLSVQGALFNENANGIVCLESSDILIEACRMAVSRADHAQTPTVSRMEMSRNALDSGSKGEKICYFDDGRLPMHNVSVATCNTEGGTWQDTAHNDVWQFRTGCTDIIARENVVNTYLSAGFVTFGAAGIEPLQRCLVADNIINEANAHGINVSGNHVEIRDNTVAESPDAVVQPRVTLTRATDGFVRGGRNTAPSFTNPSGVDLASGTINGDEVDSPEPPRINFPAWAPVVEIPPAVPGSVPVRITGIDGIRPTTTSPTVGTWLTLNRGAWTDTQDISWEYRWRRDGTPISGATSQIYQVVADDVGTSLDVECRGINPQGTGDWYTYTARTPA